MKVVFTDAQHMAELHPASFEAPTPADLDALRVGGHAKINAGRERFWVKLTHVDGNNLKGVIDNDLILTHEHGLRDGDPVEFERRHVYQTKVPPAPKGWGEV